MERDPQTQTEQAAADEAAAGAAPDPEPTDGMHTAADGEPTPPAAEPAGDGASGPESRAADAGVAQARVDAVAPEAGDEPDSGEPEPQKAAADEPDYRDQYLRAMAELDNVRKRARRDVAQAETRGIAKLARELLPALDNFARALDAAEAQPENRDHHLTDGIRLVQTELLSALARVGIEPDSPKGERFDPHCHEAIAQQPVEGAASGTIVEVYSQGYRYRDDVLRPAKVVVAA
jgi:molecular chaperone GrpE